jgi:acetate---CoA ligase (ADP-forming)
MSSYPTEFEFDVILRGGEVIQLRPIRPDDAEREGRFFTRVGPESAYQRFFRVKKELSPEELRYFTNVDYEDRMAFVAVHEGEIIAVGRYDVGVDEKDKGERVAEVAFLVEDAYQGQGVGSHLLQHLTTYARLKGITRFEAYVLADNFGMMRLFRNSGYEVRRELDEGIYSIEFPTEYSPEARAADWEHERKSVTASMTPIFYPRAVAVVGAGRDDRSIGGRLLRNLVMSGYTGAVYPVNPNAPFVRSVKAYPSLLDVPDEVDLAFIAVPAEYVLEAARQAGQKGVRSLVVISAGFGETGEAGRAVEQELVRIVRRAGMRMVGPNCMGVLNTDVAVRLNGQFGPGFPPSGNVGMSSQSGALGLAILDEASRLGIGLSSFVSLGNTADVTVNDALIYWEGDPATDVILLYMESFGSARRFGRLAKRISREKPIVVVKAGRSPVGASAVASHTGSLASPDVAVDALFHQSGVIRTEALTEMFDVASLLANQPIPGGRRVAVLSNAGGPAILAADALEANGLELPELSQDLQTRLRMHLAEAAATRNPVDMIASAEPETYRQCLRLLLESGEVESVIVVHIPTAPGTSGPAAAAIAAAAAEADSETPLLAVLMGSEHQGGALEAGTRRVPVFAYPEPAARALTAAVRYGEWRSRPEGSLVEFEVEHAEAIKHLKRALGRVGEEGGWLEPAEIAGILGAYGIDWVGGVETASEDEAVAAASEMAGPVVLKVIAESATHKSDVGGVILDVEGEDAVREAYRTVTSVVPDATGALVQPFVGSGHEVIVGMSEDPLFGPLILFGLGGIFVELTQDVTFRINPLTDLDVDQMLTEVKSARALFGYRGMPKGDIEALRELILRVSLLVERIPEIIEMDLNPVKVLEPGEGALVVDARVRVRPLTGSLVPSRKDIPGRML